MKKLYRFRKLKHDSVNKFCQFAVDGSTYFGQSENALNSEMLIYIDAEKILSKYEVSPELVNSIEMALREHVIHNYYIVCFVTTNQLDECDMWREYADDNGFCLVYDEQDILNAIKPIIIKGEKSIIFRDVDVGKSKTDLTLFLDRFLKKMNGKYYDERAVKYAAEHWFDDLKPEESMGLIQSMFHKIGDFPEKYEKRICIRDPKLKGTYIWRLLTIKPVEVICSSLMPRKEMEIIRKSARKHRIVFSIHEVNHS